MALIIPSRMRRLVGRRDPAWPQAPRNYGRAAGAQAELDFHVSAANRQFTEALEVDGIEATYWHRSGMGNFCTCSDSKSSAQLRNAQAGGLTADQQNQDDQMHDDGESVSSDEFTIRNAHELREKQENMTRSVFGVRMGELPTEEDIGSEDNAEYDAENDSDDDFEIGPEDDAIIRMSPDAGILFGGEKSQCGICFGSSVVGGYALHAGVREVFDASGTHRLYLNGFTLNTEDKPHSFEGPSDPDYSVEFDYELPAYFERCAAVVVRNNTEGARGFTLECRDQANSQWYKLDADFLDKAKGQLRYIRIRARPLVYAEERTLKLTHIEIVFQFSPWPKIQMPNMGEATNFGVFDSLLTTEITLPPTISEASKEDVIWEGKYGRLWKVTEMTDAMTARRQVMGWTAQCRVVQEFEQISLLRLARQPHYNLSFGRLESVQGNRLAAAGDF